MQTRTAASRVARVLENPATLLVMGIALGAALGSSAVYLYGDRYKAHKALQQVVPKKIAEGMANHLAFEYPMMVVSDEQGRAVYRGNVITLWDYADTFVTLGNHGIETWRRDEIDRAREGGAHPQILMQAPSDGNSDTVALWVPYFMHCPIRTMLNDLDARDWDFKHLVVTLDPLAKRFNTERLTAGGLLKKDSVVELLFVDGDGYKRRLAFATNSAPEK